MKSAFGSKRKARKILVDEDEDVPMIGTEGAETTTPVTSLSTSIAPRKSFKKSSLRQSIAISDDDSNREEGNVVNKPAIGRSSSLMKKKKTASSRLSFGPGEIISGDAAEALEDDTSFTPKKSGLGRRVVETNAFRQSLPYQALPTRDAEEEEERPKYSKDYLNELKSSTPSTPKDIQTLSFQAGVEDDEEGLDASELEGAIIVDTDPSPAFIPSEAEIREKKERRARLAKEKDFISLSDTDDDRQQLSLLPRKKQAESRLVRDDEDLGEGFDEFVEDGRISLGKKQEREAKKRQKKEMADMIRQAEGSDDEESDDSEAERRAAYEVAQTRAGMDGLHKPDDKIETGSAQVPAKITPLPVLLECLARLQNTLGAMEQDLAKRRKRMEDAQQEKIDIAARETEVQELLKQAGERYSALKADTYGAVADLKSLADAQTGFLPMPIADRGLESFGNTPMARPGVEDIG